MLSSFRNHLREMSIVLASTSPRRKEILSTCDIPFTTLNPDVPEDLDPDSFPSISSYVEALAKMKAQGALNILKEPADLVISADTVVEFEGRVIGKPADQKDAILTLETLSGKMHRVFTGVCLAWRNRSNDIMDFDQFSQCTKVFMSNLDKETIAAYVGTDEPTDKAGSYAIQGIGCSLIDHIDGDYFNVVGFPINLVCMRIRRKLLGQDTL